MAEPSDPAANAAGFSHLQVHDLVGDLGGMTTRGRGLTRVLSVLSTQEPSGNRSELAAPWAAPGFYEPGQPVKHVASLFWATQG